MIRFFQIKLINCKARWYSPCYNFIIMSEVDNDKQVKLYLQEAKSMLVVAKANLDQGFYSTTVNRAYYAVFYSANALLSSRGIFRKKHSSVMSEFRKEFIKTQEIDVEFSNFYGQLMDDRHAADYDLLHLTSKEEAKENYNLSIRFLEEVEQWLQKNYWD